MKTLMLSILVLTIASISSAQYVDIPDANFKNALIEAGVDTDKDGEISYAEAEAVISLYVSGERICDEDSCWNVGIESLTGIEGFINLDTLFCWRNNLTSLDVSNNTALKFLSCDGNRLTSLDVSGCNALTYLLCGCNVHGCGGNRLTSLDVSNNIALKFLSCSRNQLTRLDLSNNTALEVLECENNQLTSLDVSNNSALTEIDCRWNQLTSLNVSNNAALAELRCGYNQLTSLDVSSCTALKDLWIWDTPTLYEVCVWESFPAGVSVETLGSPNAYFTTDCSRTALNPDKEDGTINIYPNPANDKISIEIENINNATIEIYNVSGWLVCSKELNSKLEKIDISDYAKGIYWLKIRQANTVYIGKVVVR